MNSLEVPYTAFNAKKSFIENNKDTIINFRKAINKGLEFTKNNTSDEIARLILRQFPDTSLLDLSTVVERYKTSDSWLDNTFISEELFKNLEDMIIDGGFISSYVPYNDLIVND